MILEEGKIYYIYDRPDNTFGIFKFKGTYFESNINSPEYSYSITNMNCSWGPDDVEFTRHQINTYPFEFMENSYYNLVNREIRKSTESEIIWLEECIKNDDFVSFNYVRDALIDTILK